MSGECADCGEEAFLCPGCRSCFDCCECDGEEEEDGDTDGG